MADAIGSSESQIFKYEKDEVIPRADVVVKLARYFGVTSDYLLGLADTPQGYMETELSARERMIIQALRESSWTSFMSLVNEDLKERG